MALKMSPCVYVCACSNAVLCERMVMLNTGVMHKYRWVNKSMQYNIVIIMP